MKLLLDTHIWLWSLLEPRRLAPSVAAALERPSTERWLSPLSVWEALLLIERGRVVVDEAPAVWIQSALDRAPMLEAPVTTAVAFASRALNVDLGDPVDRFLAATAQVFELTLVTADRRLAAVRGVAVLPNRRVRRRSV